MIFYIVFIFHNNKIISNNCTIWSKQLLGICISDLILTHSHITTLSQIFTLSFIIVPHQTETLFHIFTLEPIWAFIPKNTFSQVFKSYSYLLFQWFFDWKTTQWATEELSHNLIEIFSIVSIPESKWVIAHQCQLCACFTSLTHSWIFTQFHKLIFIFFDSTTQYSKTF